MTSPRIYVGTYAKYNNGSIAGAWLDLEDYSDAEEFGEACKALHPDEEDPEYMFQDHEGIPEGMVSESHLDEEVWEWLELEEDDREMVRVYRAHEDSSASFDYIREAFAGEADSEEDFAQQLAEDIGAIPADAQWPNNCIDWEQAARDLFMDGYSLHEGLVFRAH
jgi:antirestriction protein